tara:strand:- start:11848 stop:12825 length:978 start_codon:yes stop_codon:yes gene_type:complete
MSQALQSLNAILKYRTEREKRKIDESLGMLEMGMRMKNEGRQQRLSDQLYRLRENQETRASEIYNKNKQIDNLKEQKSKLDVEITQQQLDTINQKKLDEQLISLDAAQEANKQMNSKAAINSYINSGALPKVIFNEVSREIVDGEWEQGDIKSIKSNINKAVKNTKSANAKYVKTLIDGSYGEQIIADIAGYQLGGSVDNSSYLESLSKLFLENNILSQDKYRDYLKDSNIINIQALTNANSYTSKIKQNDSIYKNSRNKGKIESILKSLNKKQQNVELDNLLKFIGEEENLNYIDRDERSALLETIDPSTGEYFTEEDINSINK